MSRKRDSQRSRVYAWERRAVSDYADRPTFDSLEECEAFMHPIWRTERGRMGLAKRAAPALSRNLWGKRNATAHGTTEIKLPKWARSPEVILHEMAHCLTHGDRHGPRFVGCFIGLLARHHGQDANDLMPLADEMGVRYNVRTVGAVPVHSLSEKLARLLPVFYMEAAVKLDVSYRTVYGAALVLIRQGRARWSGKTLKAIPHG